MATKTTDPPPTTPPEILIPKARQHRRQRHLRHAVLALICALVVATLIAAAVIVFGGPTAGGHAQTASPPRSATVSSLGQVYFRPVLCFADAYNSAQSTTLAPDPLCGPASALTEQHLDVTPNSLAQGYSSDHVAPDPDLTGVPSTDPSTEEASSTVLLPGLPTEGPARQRRALRLGPLRDVEPIDLPRRRPSAGSYRPMDRGLQDNCERRSAVGQGGAAELPSAVGDRPRRNRLLDSHHRAHPVVLLQLRRPRRHQRRPHESRRCPAGRGIDLSPLNARAAAWWWANPDLRPPVTAQRQSGDSALWILTPLKSGSSRHRSR